MKTLPAEESREHLNGIERTADRLREHPRVSPGLETWEDLRVDGDRGPIPSLLLEDFSDIPFLDDVHGIEWYQLRSRTRAGDGDVFVSTHYPIEGYEDYNQTFLGLGNPGFLHADVPDADPLCVAGTCLDDPKVMDRLAALTDEHGGLRIHPYMGARSVWKLARALQEGTRERVEVLAPPPPAAFAANHKGLLTQAIEMIMGEGGACRGVASNDLSALARAAHDSFGSFSSVGLKIANYASSTGNRIFPGAELCRGTVEQIEARIARFASAHAWDGRVEILLTEWREDVLQSPSTQLWIPPSGDGPPRVEGVFEQILTGDNFVFQGSMPSILPLEKQDEMSRMSRDLARVWQALGYVGRCSFDFVLCGDDLSDAEPLFVECNGRWGGTSIPMSLVDRVCGEDRPACYRARDYMDDRLKGMAFVDLVGVLGDTLYDVRTGLGHFILYNVGCLRDFGKFDLIAMGADREEATRRLEEELPALLNPGS